MLPKLVITDIDGVWTDGGMYYSFQGDEIKKFNTSDSAGVLYCKKLAIPIAIITGEDTTMVTRRAKKLGIKYVEQGVTDKLTVAKALCAKLGVTLDEVAYIGDDIGDYQLLKAVGYSAAPENAHERIKKQVDYVTNKKGGDGAFREFVEHILETNQVFESTWKSIVNEP